MSHMGNSGKADGVGNEIKKRNQDRDLVNESLGQELIGERSREEK